MIPARNCLLPLVLATFALVAPQGQCDAAEWVWEGEGGWTDLSQSPQLTDEGLYRRARALLVRGDAAAAAETFREVERRFPDSPLVAKAKFGRAQCEARLGRSLHAVRLCSEVLSDEISDKPLAVEVVSYQLEILRKISATNPREAAGLLRDAAGKAPTPELRYAANVAEADARRRIGDRVGVASACAAALEAASGDPERHNAALFDAALSDLLASRDVAHDDERLDRARARFQKFLESTKEGKQAEAARAYLDAIEKIQAEDVADRRQVFYAITYVPEMRYDKARPVFKRAAKQFRGTAAGETGHFYHAECRYLQNKIWKAFALYETFMKEYPGTKYLRQLVEREFAIGEALAGQGKRRKTVLAFEAVARNNPNGPLADDAEMAIGRCHLAAKKYAAAKAAFKTVADEYPESEWVSAAVFHGGVADLKSSEVSSDNEDLLGKARDAFELYLRRSPDGPFAPEAQERLADCRERQALGLMKIARFYERRKRTQAAAWYYGLLLREHPDSALAAAARTSMEYYKEGGLRVP